MIALNIALSLLLVACTRASGGLVLPAPAPAKGGDTAPPSNGADAKPNVSPDGEVVVPPSLSDEIPPQVPPPDQAGVEALVAKDFQQLGSERAGVRYVSIAHLGSLPAKDLQTVRFGLEKALNGVSWAPELGKLTPLDESRTVFRMKIADYGLGVAQWNSIERAEQAEGNVLRVGDATLVKGDWLVFAVTRPEVYDRLVKIPQVENMLERSLGVDRSRAVYMGVTDSPVAYAPRMLERIPITQNGKEGYYWRSYDFFLKGSADRALKTGDVSYASGRGVSQLIAGEFIFSLPNGLQAYMLSGFGAQHRFDADARVARDGRREDKLVLNGESCITCHAAGLNYRKDEVRPGLGGDSAAVAKFPDQATLDALFEKDNKRFQAALDALGYPEISAEPVARTLDVFKKDRSFRDFRTQRGETDAVFGLME